MDIIAGDTEILGIIRIDKRSLVTPLKNVTDQRVANAVSLSIGSLEPLHSQ